MQQGEKSAYTDKQKRQAEHIEEGYEDRGVGKGEAERRAWATVNRQSGGGNQSGAGRGQSEDPSPSRKGAASVVRRQPHARQRSGQLQRKKRRQRASVTTRRAITAEARA